MLRNRSGLREAQCCAGFTPPGAAAGGRWRPRRWWPRRGPGPVVSGSGRGGRRGPRRQDDDDDGECALGRRSLVLAAEVSQSGCDWVKARRISWPAISAAPPPQGRILFVPARQAGGTGRTRSCCFDSTGLATAAAGARGRASRRRERGGHGLPRQPAVVAETGRGSAVPARRRATIRGRWEENHTGADEFDAAGLGRWRLHRRCKFRRRQQRSPTRRRSRWSATCNRRGRGVATCVTVTGCFEREDIQFGLGCQSWAAEPGPGTPGIIRGTV